jgi:hypothetical protein
MPILKSMGRIHRTLMMSTAAVGVTNHMKMDPYLPILSLLSRLLKNVEDSVNSRS